ncbi:hypothetical protein B0P06_002609 [Clostridium saccharoperbutylacetonicum]|uniref:Uncharacterized protein n=1 Tax=Clostridium saccharoperbutylacetonicum N1-4(HMT) TaxID=931276 RepID=M1MWV0_9CLOT|nr:hypothetical protein Cspa_c53110 [Clostridium saccharoperbutylacetonicum N1-4(HMT)]AQR97725.1 hypothetical protein CLSAP_50580 [Clostridium saccharoperbutylacetonicum]NRT60156.1 hypothetical protein [Clostridium saccharoperbutylacetonicum]NSB23468.1 hypothetical protein [Clostridium saccharoperbutylacetonicum]NSB33613.1 hypothetical protein [Clostridium saccharoperbutylacetonicum]
MKSKKIIALMSAVVICAGMITSYKSSRVKTR